MPHGKSETSFLRSVRGSIAIMTALIGPVIILFGGCLVDVGLGQKSGVQLQNAADAAALAGVKAGNDYLNQNGIAPASRAQAMQVAQQVAQTSFGANLQQTPIRTTAQANASATFDGTTTTVRVSASATYPTSFLRLIGVNQFNLARTASSAATFSSKWYQVLFLVDTSGSMGIGGTSQYISELQNQWGCAFACHDPNHYYSSVDRRAVSKQMGMLSKIDFENSALTGFMQALSPYAQKYPGQFAVSITSFGTSVNALLAPTTDITQAQNVASSLDMDAIGPQNTNWGYTHTTDGLQSVLNALTNVGDGSSPTKKKTFVVFISDGVEDTPNPGGPYGRKMDLAYPALCQQIQAKGATMFSIWTQYYPVADAQYNYFIAPISSQIPTQMQSCASASSDYFVASDGPAIVDAVNQTFAAIIANADVRLKS